MEDKETTDFIMEIENRRGGKMKYRTYSTWFADNSGNIREYGVFLYQIDRTFYFEDFEKENRIFGIPLSRKKKNQKEYVKLEGSFKVEDVKSITLVSKNSALGYCQSKNISNLPSPANVFSKLFNRLITMVELEGEKVLFLELIDQKKFNQIMEEK
ncbi:MAG: hypothetical protein WC162_09100 [Sphaerochaetaceae bacterium]|nr:hypothetical protein [Sphaerochaetaceae bacterium]